MLISHGHRLLKELLSDVTEVGAGEGEGTDSAHGLKASDPLNLL